MSEAEIGEMTSVTGAKLETWTWKPAEQPRAIVQIVHGMAEHIARYDSTAMSLNEADILVVGHTMLGHGKRAETLGWFTEQDGWDHLVEDIHALRLKTQQEYPGVPYFLLGHSMGSFLVRTYCLSHEAGLTGVVLSGTAHYDPPLLQAALLIANLQCLFGGAKKPSKLLEKMSFAGYNDGWAPPRTEYDWLSKDEANVDRYVEDPYCGFPFTASGYRDLFHGLTRLYPKNLAAMDKSIPVRLFSGDSDPVGKSGQGVKTTMEELLAAGISDVSMKLYENGRHEMLNETERELVCNDLVSWIDDHLPKEKAEA